MKQLILPLLVLFTIVSVAFSQPAHKSKNKAEVQLDSLFDLSRKYFVEGKLDSVPNINKQMLPLAQKLNVDSNYFKIDVSIAEYFYSKADYTQVLEYVFKALELAQRGYRKSLPVLYANIGLTYLELDNYQSALYYLRKGQQSLSSSDDVGNPKAFLAENLARVYQATGKPDSALKYIQEAYQLNFKKETGQKKVGDQQVNQAAIYRTFALVYELLNEPELVDYYFKKSISYSDSLKVPAALATTSNQYSAYLIKQQKYADAKKYALLAFNTAKRSGFKKQIIEASSTLFDVNNQLGHNDSAYYYLKINHLYQDSLLTEQKVNQMQSLITSQQLHEAEQTAKVEQDEEQRKHNIQYAAIALGLVLLVMLFLLISRLIVNTRVIEIVGVIGLLIVFEFINLVIHPYIARLTNDSPLLMLLILVLIAAVIVPLHHQLEHWIKHKLVEKNKAIRLAAAKKTIEQLEGGK
ncbi:MAG: Tetratricopeptide repeat-containing protein [Mucilaginibacter sp.]|nr:Tetratricopeptide repeat-containing protein [Mucilaginibacter sp.]